MPAHLAPGDQTSPSIAQQARDEHEGALSGLRPHRGATTAQPRARRGYSGPAAVKSRAVVQIR
jgi:hypothetical protein